MQRVPQPTHKVHVLATPRPSQPTQRSATPHCSALRSLYHSLPRTHHCHPPLPAPTATPTAAPTAPPTAAPTAAPVAAPAAARTADPSAGHRCRTHC